jgi:decaprenylphospho-beta-D-ribofuranose 2-oxidase
MRLSGWGRYPVHDARLRAPRDETALRGMVAEGRAIARGNGRSYGDSAISLTNTIHMIHFNRMLAFDCQSGLLTVEAGVLLSDIIETFLPQGWFPYVTPGTKFVTVGGLIAADVHGKNHHKDGGFGNFVEWIDLMGGDGAVQRCSSTESPDLFKWTLGGMGLTGVILRAAFRLRKVETAWIKQRTFIARNLDRAIDLFEQNDHATYSVAWIDCLKRGQGIGRSVVILGEHATVNELGVTQAQKPLEIPKQKKLSIPFNLPSWVLNHMTVSAFNEFYYRSGHRKSGETIVDWDTYFYPLDTIEGWNKIYGRCGFVQFQCVIPSSKARSGLDALLKAITKSRIGSFLAVLKKLGPSSGGIAFPLTGYTLALDFAAHPKTFSLLSELEQITVEHGGRFYLAKDGVLTADRMEATDKRVAEFRRIRQQIGSSKVFESVQSQRLAI